MNDNIRGEGDGAGGGGGHGRDEAGGVGGLDPAQARSSLSKALVCLGEGTLILQDIGSSIGVSADAHFFFEAGCYLFLQIFT